MVDLCPACGETVWIRLGQPHFQYTFHCETCGTTWTMTELEIYELSHPSDEVLEVVNMMMKLAYDMAMEDLHE